MPVREFVLAWIWRHVGALWCVLGVSSFAFVIGLAVLLWEIHRDARRCP